MSAGERARMSVAVHRPARGAFLLVVMLGVALNVYEDSTGFSGWIGFPFRYCLWTDVVAVEHWVDDQGRQHAGTRPEHVAARRRELAKTMGLNAALVLGVAVLVSLCVELGYRVFGVSDPLERPPEDPDILALLDGLPGPGPRGRR